MENLDIFVGIVVLWINPLTYEEKVLFTQDKDKVKFRFPGGGFESEKGDREAADTAIRELKEETGLETKKEDLKLIFKCTQSSDTGGKHTKLFFSLLIVQEDEPLVKLGDEVESYFWAGERDLKKLLSEKKIAYSHTLALNDFLKNRGKFF